MKYAEQIIHRLIQTKKTIASAESCTGGLLAGCLTDIPGASACFKIGLVTYSNEAKNSLLKVPKSYFKRFGAVSEKVAMLMAKNARKIYKTDHALAITGIAGPNGGTKTKPVGLVYIAYSSKYEDICLKCVFKGDRRKIRHDAVLQALKLLEEAA